MGFASGRDIHVTLPRLQYGDGEVRRRAETEQANSLALLNPGNPKRAKADDAGTEKRGRVQVIKTFGQRENKIRTRDRIIRVSAIDAVPRISRRVTKIFKIMAAIPAAAVGSADP